MGAVEAETAPGDHAVRMGMEAKVSAPSVQHGADAKLSAKAFGVSREFEEAPRCGVKQQRVQSSAIAPYRGSKLRRQLSDRVDTFTREHDVKVVHRHDTLSPFVEPTGVALALDTWLPCVRAMAATSYRGRTIVVVDVVQTPCRIGLGSSPSAE